MKSPFKIGEIAVGQNHIRATCRNGMEMEIAGPLEEVDGYDSVTGELLGLVVGHDVIWADGDSTFVPLTHMRKKQPPSDLQKWAESKVKNLIKPVLEPA